MTALVPSRSDLSLLWAQALQESFQTEISLQEQEEVQEPQEEEDSLQGPQQTLQVQVSLKSLFHTAIPENTQKICPGMVWFWFIHTASDFPESVRAFTHNT